MEVNESFDDRYVDKKELSKILGIAIKTIDNNSHRIKGRVKIGGAVRYHLPTIKFVLQSGKNLFSGDKKC